MKILPQIKALAIGSLLLSGAGLLRADVTYTFQQGVDGYDGVEDTYIRSDNNTLNYGSSSTLTAGYSSSTSSGYDISRESRNILIYFDVSSLVGETVTSATITLTVSSVGSGGGEASCTLYAYELLTDWSEGTGNASSGVANWDDSTSTSSWEVSGAQGTSDRDYDTVYTSDSFTVNGDSPTVVAGSTITITLSAELIQSWIDDPSSNYGILISLVTAQSYRYPGLVFYSSESGTDGPVLTVNTIPEPSQMACLAGMLIGIGTLIVRRRKHKNG